MTAHVRLTSSLRPLLLPNIDDFTNTTKLPLSKTNWKIARIGISARIGIQAWPKLSPCLVVGGLI